MVKHPDLHAYYAAFFPLPEQDWEKLEQHAREVRIDKGDSLIRTQEPTPFAYALLSGIARNFYTTLEGREYTKIFLTKGQIVSPYIENITGIAPRSTVEALTDITALRIPFDDLIEVLESTPDLVRLHLRLIQSFYVLKEKREYELLTLNATQRYALFLEEFADYIDLIPNMHIASYLGITPVSLSRLRRGLSI
ncbi:MAG: Crp/Fnr family transcriptional regulator [Gammaproteobacteria bacterium]